MTSKSPPNRKAKKPKDTPAKQYERFLETAEAVGVSKDPKAFDRAFREVVPIKNSPKGRGQ